MEKGLYTKEEVEHFIKQGKIMLLSASEDVLKTLPNGNWIAGTSPYFMDKTGGQVSFDKIFVDDFTDIAQDFKIEFLDESSIQNIARNAYENGFSILVLPFESAVYYKFALHSLEFEDIYKNPIVGFVAGVHLDTLDQISAKTAAQTTITDKQAVVLHIKLPENTIARTEIVNLDSIDNHSPRIEFPVTSFTQSECLIDGKVANIAEYLHSIQPKSGFLQLIANLDGALINRDVKKIDTTKKEVTFFSPAFVGDVYYLADFGKNYQADFVRIMEGKKSKPIYCTICVSYFNAGNLENKKIGVEGTFAFGEISYQLLNKTLVSLEIDYND